MFQTIILIKDMPMPRALQALANKKASDLEAFINHMPA